MFSLPVLLALLALLPVVLAVLLALLAVLLARAVSSAATPSPHIERCCAHAHHPSAPGARPRVAQVRIVRV
ncbi:hypothetical protein BH24ACT14_BH24ACT14_05920 [soil metagenome]